MASHFGMRVLFCSRHGGIQEDPFPPTQNIGLYRYALDSEEARLVKVSDPYPLPVRFFNIPLLRRWKRFFLPDLIKLQTRSCLSGFQPDLVVACGLNSLPAALFLKKKTGCKVIYDSAELEMHRNAKTSPLLEHKRQRIEKEAMRNLDEIVVPSPSIAEHLMQSYALKNRPLIIRNLPFSPLENIERSEADRLEEKRAIKQIIYVGYRGPGRGLDFLLQAMVKLPEVYQLKCIGGHHPDMENKLRSLAESLEITDRIELCEPVPPEEVVETIRTADASFIGVENRCLSYFFSLPNKLFQSLFAGIPVVAPAFPDINQVVLESGMGVCFKDFTSSDIAAALIEACQLKEKADWSDKCEELAERLNIQEDISLFKTVLLGS
ncbi:MAG: glycosyltransferase [Sneathiellales bacterium]|nr:glycosyltransferase [Sneathiellales bacterium]